MAEKTTQGGACNAHNLPEQPADWHDSATPSAIAFASFSGFKLDARSRHGIVDGIKYLE